MTFVRYNVPMPAQVGKPNANGQVLVQKPQEAPIIDLPRCPSIHPSGPVWPV